MEIVADALSNLDIDLILCTMWKRTLYMETTSVHPSICPPVCLWHSIYQVLNSFSDLLENVIPNFMKMWQKLLSKFTFRENRHSVVHTLLIGEHEFRRLCSALMTDMDEIQHKRSLYNTTENLWVLWKSVRRRPYFSSAHKLSYAFLYTFFLSNSEII